jgi:NAD(P)-dependent dehydrogenase (short-subunit alcohol dehydrogenase family)
MAITSFHGKLVVITGAASGIGRAAALAFASRGARIVASDVNAGALESVCREVEALGTTCLPYAVDVADEAAMRRFADDVEAIAGAPDVLVNNAGIGYIGPFLASDLAHWPRVLGVNVMGVVHGCYFFIPKMIEAGGDRRVLVVSSAAALYPPPSLAAYAASKFAVFGLAEVLKMELRGTRVGVTTVCPGVINTPIVTVQSGGANVAPSVSAEQVQRLQAYYAKRGVGPESVAEDMVRAVEREIDVLLTGPSAHVLFWLRRVSLRLVRALSYLSAREVGYR